MGSVRCVTRRRCGTRMPEDTSVKNKSKTQRGEKLQRGGGDLVVCYRAAELCSCAMTCRPILAAASSAPSGAMLNAPLVTHRHQNPIRRHSVLLLPSPYPPRRRRRRCLIVRQNGRRQHRCRGLASVQPRRGGGFQQPSGRLPWCSAFHVLGSRITSSWPRCAAMLTPSEVQ